MPGAMWSAAFCETTLSKASPEILSWCGGRYSILLNVKQSRTMYVASCTRLQPQSLCAPDCRGSAAR